MSQLYKENCSLHLISQSHRNIFLWHQADNLKQQTRTQSSKPNKQHDLRLLVCHRCCFVKC